MDKYPLSGLPIRLQNLVERRQCSSLVATPCWCWLGRLNRNGYGRTYYKGREPVIHRIFYEILVGPVPPGAVLDHLCKTRRCGNPAHMEPVTHKENVARGDAVLFRPLKELQHGLV